MTCAPSEDSDRPGHPPSLISLCCPHGEDSDQTGRMPRLSSFYWFCHAPAHLDTFHIMLHIRTGDMDEKVCLILFYLNPRVGALNPQLATEND